MSSCGRSEEGKKGERVRREKGKEEETRMELREEYVYTRQPLDREGEKEEEIWKDN